MQSERGGEATKPLEARILKLFKEAYSSVEFEAAEHLLQALEALAAKCTDADLPARQRCLDDAYLSIAGKKWPQRRRTAKHLN